MSESSLPSAAMQFLIHSDEFVVELDRIVEALPPEAADELHLAVDIYRRSLAEFRSAVVAIVDPPVPKAPPGHGGGVEPGRPS